ncbi:hypothetical protein DENSPDRAFT_231757 [Dentipellis sp. KUC8613]|nr:hypothetical protein DENSPDRAFT_231757 [Dentipellis sp. KUC8613]
MYSNVALWKERARTHTSPRPSANSDHKHRAPRTQSLWYATRIFTPTRAHFIPSNRASFRRGAPNNQYESTHPHRLCLPPEPDINSSGFACGCAVCAAGHQARSTGDPDLLCPESTHRQSPRDPHTASTSTNTNMLCTQRLFNVYVLPRIMYADAICSTGATASSDVLSVCTAALSVLICD